MKFFLFAALMMLVSPRSAYAYLDAGTGSMILQALVAGVGGVIVLLKMFWGNIMGFFRGSKSKK